MCVATMRRISLREQAEGGIKAMTAEQKKKKKKGHILHAIIKPLN